MNLDLDDEIGVDLNRKNEISISQLQCVSDPESQADFLVVALGE
jgi:hypothetical protein